MFGNGNCTLMPECLINLEENLFLKELILRLNYKASKSESIELTRMCPVGNRGEYEYAKEKTLVKMIIKHLQQTEYAKTIKELLQEMKVERMVKRRIERAGNANENET